MDQSNHVAWVAVDPSRREEPGLGIGRFVRLDDRPTVAEFALTVIDAHQGKGLGTYLLALLCLLAEAHGVRLLRGWALSENHRVTDWLTRLGAAARYSEGICRLELPVPRPAAQASSNPTSRRFRGIIARLHSRLAQNPGGVTAGDGAGRRPHLNRYDN